MEKLLQEQERELKEENDLKLRDNLQRHSTELTKYIEQLHKLQQDNSQLEVQLKSHDHHTHQLDLKVLELSETIKNDKLNFDRTLDSLKREKDLQISHLTEDLTKAKQDLAKSDSTLLTLKREL